MLKNTLPILLIVLLSGCATPQQNTLVQVSTIDALLASVYDGEMTCGQLLEQGNFGLGTFNKLDGEMIVLDGNVYQAKADGTVNLVDSDLTTPFAAVVNFSPDQSATAKSGDDYAALKKEIDRLAPNQNIFYAVKLTGSFLHVKVRSVPGQKKPYPPLAEVAKHQSVFEYTNQTGTVVGFRCPAYVKGINVPEYHLHFLSDDKTKGGHILDFKITEAKIELDRCNKFLMILPEESSAFGNVDLSKDRSKELHKVER